MTWPPHSVKKWYIVAPTRNLSQKCITITPTIAEILKIFHHCNLSESPKVRLRLYQHWGVLLVSLPANMHESDTIFELLSDFGFKKSQNIARCTMWPGQFNSSAGADMEILRRFLQNTCVRISQCTFQAICSDMIRHLNSWDNFTSKHREAATRRNSLHKIWARQKRISHEKKSEKTTETFSIHGWQLTVDILVIAMTCTSLDGKSSQEFKYLIGF